MKLFKIFVSFFVIVGLFFGISFLFPHTYKVERSIEINKPVSGVFTFMGDLKNWEKWSVWNNTLDSSLYIFYSQRTDSIGAKQYFNGNLLGTGRFIINNYQPNSIVGYNLHMHGSEVKANGTFFFRAKNNTTLLTWIDSGDVGYNPIFRYMIPSKVSSTEKAFDDGLKRIKEVLEKQQ